jgi:hypothetical protein
VFKGKELFIPKNQMGIFSVGIGISYAFARISTIENGVQEIVQENIEVTNA